MTGPIAECGSPFVRASATGRRLKLFLWGDSGAGKTTTALQFPGPAVIDPEGGSEHYGGDFIFDVLKATTADEIASAVDWLLTHDHKYRTLVIDPITLYWDALQSKWSDIFLRRNKGSKGHRLEYYSFQARDWMTIKAEWKELIRKLLALDLNVIVTARQKALYADRGFMRQVGETFDGEKSLPYLFDTILHLYRDEAGRFMAENLKDRTNKLPQGRFEISYQLLADRIGEESLGRKAVPLELVTPSQLETLRHLITASGMKQETVKERLAAYGASRLEDLTTENADLIIMKLKAAVEESTTAVTTQDKETEDEDRLHTGE
ncbi:MAG: AAA family ATPase [bacterium]|nr:AAA family ATPase [bacterium]